MNILTGFKLAARLHAGQLDQAGRPYIEHLVRVFIGVLERGGDRDQQLASLLHDSIEDGHATADSLLEEGVPRRAVGMVLILSKPEGMPYEEYVAIVKQHPDVLPIKEEDLKDNSDEDRLSLLDAVVAARLRAKYGRALAILSAA